MSGIGADRTLGRSQVQVSAVGFGGAAIGNLYEAIPDETATAAVAAALEGGLRFFDTAPFYGFGLSETRLGLALAGREAVVSTKVGRLLEPVAEAEPNRFGFVDGALFEPVFDYGYDAVMRSYEESLVRLGRDRIEVLLAHDLGVVTHGVDHPRLFKQFMDGGYRAMRELRDSGAVGAIGLGANEWQVCEQALGAGDFDCFLLAGRYTLLEQTALDSFFPACAAKGASVIVGGPFNSGILVRGVGQGGPLWYDYAPAPPEIVDRVGRLERACADFGVALPAAALQFPLRNSRVSAVIPGLASPGQVAQALAWLDATIPSGFWTALAEQGLLHPEAPVGLEAE